jgi:hypothetical protein
MNKEHWSSQYLTMIEDCEARDHMLSDWDRGFLDSFRGAIEHDRSPSQKMIDKLDEIWEKATSKG